MGHGPRSARHPLRGPVHTRLITTGPYTEFLTVPLAQFAVLMFQRLDPLLLVGRRTGPLALVALGLPDPAAQCFGRAADLYRDRADRPPTARRDPPRA